MRRCSRSSARWLVGIALLALAGVLAPAGSGTARAQEADSPAELRARIAELAAIIQRQAAERDDLALGVRHFGAILADKDRVLVQVLAAVAAAQDRAARAEGGEPSPGGAAAEVEELRARLHDALREREQLHAALQQVGLHLEGQSRALRLLEESQAALIRHTGDTPALEAALRELREGLVEAAARDRARAQGEVERLRDERAQLEDRLLVAQQEADTERRRLIEELDAGRIELAQLQDGARREVARLEAKLDAQEAPAAKAVADAERMRAAGKALVLATLAAGRPEVRAGARELAAGAGILEAGPVLAKALATAGWPVEERLAAAQVAADLGEAAAIGPLVAGWIEAGTLGPGHAGRALELAIRGGVDDAALAKLAARLGPLGPVELDVARATAGSVPALAALAERAAAGGEAGKRADAALADLLPAPAPGSGRTWKEAVGLARGATRAEVADSLRVLRVLDERMATVRFEDTPLPDVAGFLSDLTGVPFRALPGAAEAVVSGAAADERLSALVRRLIDPAGLRFEVESGVVLVGTAAELAARRAAGNPLAVTAGGSPTEVRIARTLSDLHLTVDLQETPLTECAAFFREVSGLDLVLLPALRERDPAVSIRLRDVRMETVLRLVLAEAGARGELRWGAIVLGSAEELAALGDPAWPGAPALDQRVTVHFEETALEDVVLFLRDITGLEVALAEEGLLEGRVATLDLRDARLGDLLSLVCRPRGLDWRFDEDARRLELSRRR